MDDLRKTLIMLSAAATMTTLGTDAAIAGQKGKKKPADKDRVQRTKGKKEARKRVKRVKRARRRAPRVAPDLTMPAGTLYDVLAREDLP